MKGLGSLLYTVASIAIAMIGYHIHQSIFWSIMDFIFAPIAVCKWLIYHEINVTVIKDTFSFLLK